MAGAVRKKPNCFNLLRQLNVLQQMRRSDVGGLEVPKLCDEEFCSESSWMLFLVLAFGMHFTS